MNSPQLDFPDSPNQQGESHTTTVVGLSESFDEAWGELECQIEQLFESACASKTPTTIGNRVMPPSLEDALKMMLAEA